MTTQQNTSLPFMARDDGEAVRVGNAHEANDLQARRTHFPTLAASRPSLPIKGREV
jgi:hypothetical protein